MLSSVRNALKGVVAWFVIVLLILAFALFGVPELRSFTQKSAIRVGSEGVDAQVVLGEFNRLVINRQYETQGAFTRADAIASGLPDQIVSGLATRSMLEQEADKMGLAMPRSLVKELLSEDKRFQNPSTGLFDEEILARILQEYNFSAREFEDQIRKELMRNQLLNSLRGGGFTPDAVVDSLLLRSVEERKVDYLVVNEEMAGIPEEPSPDKLKAFYEGRAQAYTKPEYRAFSLISLRKEELRKELSAPEETLKQLYESQKAQFFEKAETRTLFQIPFSDEASAKAAVESLRNGTLVEEIAKERGLSLEAITYADIERSGILDADVAAAAFSTDLKEGDVSEPVKGAFSWTVIQVAVITPEQTQPFEEVRDELEAQLLEQDVQKKMFDALDAIEDARDAGLDLAEAATDVGGLVKEISPVDRFSFAPGGAIIGDVPGEALIEAFKLSEGEESEAIEFADKEGWFFVVVKEITPPALSPYEDVEADVETDWRRDERTRRIARAVNQIRDALTAGGDLKEAVAPFNATPLEASLSRRQATEAFDQALLSQVFTADKGTAVSGGSMGGEAQTIAVVSDISYNTALVDETVKSAVAQNYAQQFDQELLDAYLTALNSDYNVRVDQAQIDALFNAQ